MDYYKYHINCSVDQTEILIAFLGDLPFDTFQEVSTGLDAFIATKSNSELVEKEVLELSERFEFEFEKELIKARNWNQVWESNFQPIIIEDFCIIKADFHQVDAKTKHEIIINPKMAFGTGHHATTHMMIELMEALDFNDRKILDFGCGTGILAILAAQLGARTIEAVDIELASFENTQENAKINNISCINAIHGTLLDVKETAFDIILANINRNVILDALPTLYDRLAKNGKLIASGFIKKDTELLIKSSEQFGFSVLSSKNKDNWVAMVLEKT